jgi:maltooligosyltrehalose trehalohydrolase
VVAIQNHDQVGNRGWGERLAALVDFPYLKAAAGLLFFAPYVPLIFMGEEYGEKNPFLFFTDYQDPELKRNISLGRKEEFKKFGWQEIPDPQDPATFYRSRLTPRRLWREENRRLFRYYRDLIALRLSHPVLREPDKRNLEIKVDGASRLVVIARWREGVRLTGLFNLGDRVIPIEGFQGREIFNSEWRAYGGEEEGESRSLKKGQVVILES